MGIHVCLDILPRAIDPAAWAEAYDDSLAVLRAHPGGLLGLFYRDVEGVSVPMYTTAIEDTPDRSAGRCWRVVGDLRSRQTGEVFELYRDARHYHRGARRGDGDIVVVAARGEEAPTSVFHAKTQGLPYHLTVLAAVMAIETRLPRLALAWGDIEVAQAERARAFAERVLGHPIALPVRVDAAALARRLAPAYRGQELLHAFSRLLVLDPFGRDEPLLRVFPRASTEPWFRAELCQADPATARRLLARWLDATSDLAALCRLACLDPGGPQWPPERLAEELLTIGIADPGPPRSPAKPEGEPYDLDLLLRTAFAALAGAGPALRLRLDRERIAAAWRQAFGCAPPPRLVPRGRAPASRRGARGQPHAPAGRTGPGEATGPAGPAAPAAAGPRVGPGGPGRPSDGFARLLQTAGPDDLEPEDREAILAVTYAARCIQRQLGPHLARRLAGDAAAARRALAHIVAERGPRLTEPAWDAIRGEQDARVLSFMTALCFFDYLPASRVARAMLENLPLARFGAAAARDDLAMRRVRAAMGPAARPA